MQKKKFLIEKVINKKRIKKHNEIWEGRLCNYEMVYLDMGDGEQYPIPRPAGELIRDLLKDVNLLERKYSPIIPIYVRDYKRIPLEIRVYIKDC